MQETSSNSRAGEHGTLASRITDSIRTAIINGEIAPGSKLSEPQLAIQFETSRGPIREAIRRLETQNLVRHVPHEGVRVITLDDQEMSAIYEVREALEGMAAGLAAQRMSDEEIIELKELLQLHRNHQSETGEYMQADGDFDFHYRIIQGSKNQFLIRQLCDDLYHLIRMFRYRSSRFQNRSEMALIEHEQLIHAISQRDSQLAEMIMRRHIARAREDIGAAMNQEDEA